MKFWMDIYIPRLTIVLCDGKLKLKFTHSPAIYMIIGTKCNLSNVTIMSIS